MARRRPQQLEEEFSNPGKKQKLDDESIDQRNDQMGAGTESDFIQPNPKFLHSVQDSSDQDSKGKNENNNKVSPPISTPTPPPQEEEGVDEEVKRKLAKFRVCLHHII